MMSKAKTCVAGLFGIAAIAMAMPVMAADFTTYAMGNSLSGDLASHFRSFANTYQVNHGNTYRWGQQYRPSTTLTYLHDNPTDSGMPNADKLTQSGINLTSTQWFPNTNNFPWNVALPNNKWDAVILEPFQSTSGAAAPYVCTLGSDTGAVNDIIPMTRNAPGGVNASTRFFIYAAWPMNNGSPMTNAQFQAKFTAATDNTDAQPGALTRGYYRNLHARVHTNNPDVSLSVIPVGEVYYSLSAKMQAGQFSNSNLTSISQLYRDPYHANFLGQDIVAWTAYATLFKESPVGLPAGPNLPNTIGAGYSEFLTTSLTPADKTLIQQTIWEVVSNDLAAYTNVPEPASMGLLATLISAAALRRRR